MSPQPPAPHLDRLDAALAAGLLVVGGCALGAWRIGWSLWGALGTDAALWGLTAMDLRVGASPLVPPGYPALVSLVARITGDLVSAGVAVSLASAAALGALVLVAARVLGAGRPWALGAGALAIAVPDAVGWSQQLQPDALAAAGIVGASALAAAAAGGSTRAAWGAAVLAGLLPLVREHGVPVAGLVALGLGLGCGRRAAAPVGLLLAAWWLSPLIAGVAPGLHPLDVPWGERAGGALSALSATSPDELSFLRELHRGERQAYVALLERGDRLGQLRWHAERSLRLAWDGWGWLALAGASALVLRRDRRIVAAALPLLAAAPALLIWSQRRHVLLLVPLAMAVCAAGASRLPRVRRLVGIALGAALLVPWPRMWQALGEGQRSERHRAEHFAAVGVFLAENAPPHSFLGGVFQDIGLYHPLARHDPDGTAADWSTFLVTDRPPPPSPWGQWARLHTVGADPTRRGSGLGVYRLAPDRDPRPCLGAPPAPGTAHLAVHRAHADLPGCDPSADDHPR